MAKEATLQVRMDAELKEQAEALYREMGTSLAEAVRILPNKVCLRMACLLLFRQIEAVLMAALPNMQII